MKEYVNLCDDHELVYTNYAYFENPRVYDNDDVIFIKTYKYWFKVILDGFEEICRRLKENKK